jgi:hypothetical protein
MDLFDDLDAESPITHDPKYEFESPEAVRRARRQAELAMIALEASYLAVEGWALIARDGPAISVWKRPDGKYVAQYPGKTVEL